jgi:hypothetical protein
MLVLSLFTLLLAAGAQADTSDPAIIIRSGGDSIPLGTNQIVLTFPGQPGCISGTYNVPGPFFGLPWMQCGFKNASPGPFDKLVFTINTPQLPLTLQCSGLCVNFTQGANGGVATFFFSPPIPNAPPGFEFIVDFINFQPGTTVGLQANVPEPGTLALLGTGAAALLARRRKPRSA